ncbi:hypothetical protein ABZ890_43370 [Streptomyces sp. NPDC046984]|uniref:hypothetical protein n=1 Tax=Streptomyces sp. NPDC046984 TaxID=3155138 RepID=UPI003409C522
MRDTFAVVVVHPPTDSGRRVTVEGRTMGYARSSVDVLWLVWEAGLDPDDVRLDDPDWIDWCDAGPEVWRTRG